MITILHNNKQGNNFLVAKTIASRFDCQCLAAEDNPSLSDVDFVVIVVSNTGDEELPQPMEDYLSGLSVKNKRYAVCELGNYFGFENYCGCKKIVIGLLDSLEWSKVSDISLDSLPKLDIESLEEWLEILRPSLSYV